eukprot:746797-Hanusia_phi.AAC.4
MSDRPPSASHPISLAPGHAYHAARRCGPERDHSSVLQKQTAFNLSLSRPLLVACGHTNNPVFEAQEHMGSISIHPRLSHLRRDSDASAGAVNESTSSQSCSSRALGCMQENALKRENSPHLAPHARSADGETRLRYLRTHLDAIIRPLRER